METPAWKLCNHCNFLLARIWACCFRESWVTFLLTWIEYRKIPWLNFWPCVPIQKPWHSAPSQTCWARAYFGAQIKGREPGSVLDDYKPCFGGNRTWPKNIQYQCNNTPCKALSPILPRHEYLLIQTMWSDEGVRPCVCVRVWFEVPSCEWGNQICEAPEWGPPRKEGEEGEEGGREGWDGWEGGVPRLLARKVPMKEAEELPINPLPAFPQGQR